MIEGRGYTGLAGDVKLQEILRGISVLKRAACRQVGRKHTRALTGEAFADGTADPAAPTRNKRGFTIQHHACSAFSYASSTSPWK